MQAGIIALAGGASLRHVPANSHVSTWPYILFGYAFMAVAVPWSVGCFVDGEFGLPSSIIFGVIAALPFWAAARWLASTPYHLISWGCWVMVGLWGLHFLVSVGATLRRR